jgi:hypothetical protein
VADDWAALYHLAPSPIQAGQTRQAFVASMTSQSTPKFVSASLSGAGSESTQNGLVYWTQDVVLKVTGPAGHASPYTAEIQLAKQGGAWKFWTTSSPQPAP